MKKVFTLIAVAAMFAACAGNANKTAEATEAEEVATEEVACECDSCACDTCACAEAAAPVVAE